MIKAWPREEKGEHTAVEFFLYLPSLLLPSKTLAKIILLIFLNNVTATGEQLPRLHTHALQARANAVQRPITAPHHRVRCGTTKHSYR